MWRNSSLLLIHQKLILKPLYFKSYDIKIVFIFTRSLFGHFCKIVQISFIGSIFNIFWLILPLSQWSNLGKFGLREYFIILLARGGFSKFNLYRKSLISSLLKSKYLSEMAFAGMKKNVWNFFAIAAIVLKIMV